MDHLANVTYQHRVEEVMPDMDLVLGEHFEQIWLATINRLEARRGPGRNKLRTYCTFKQDFVTEQYVTRPMPKSRRSALAKFRCGVAPIRIETGRYERLPLEQRVCPVCTDTIETEFHVVMNCPLYGDIRDTLLHKANSIPGFDQSTPEHKFQKLMSNDSVIQHTANACYYILRLRQAFTHT